MNTIVLHSFLIAFALLISPLQTVKPYAAPRQVTKFTCPDPESGKSCVSLQEMLNAKDKEILSWLEGTSDYTYACFSRKEDSFFLVGFTVPTSKSNWHTENGFASVTNIFNYNQYKDGVTSSNRFVPITWLRLENESAEDATASPYQPPNDTTPPKYQVSINNSEIEFSYSYDNVGGTTTDWDLKLRRSTLKYVVTFGVKSDHSQFTETGSCVVLLAPKVS